MREKQTERLNKQDNIYLKVLIAIIILIIAVVMLSRSTNIVQNVLVSYDTESDIDYKVYLFNNDYIKSDYMGEGKLYIADLVTEIATDFKYKIETSKKFNSEYKYEIIAKATVNHNSTGKLLWSEEIKLVENGDVKVVDNKSISITDSVKLPYNQINTKVKMFKNQYDIPIRAYVDLDLIIKDKKTNEEIATTGISMDLFEDVFEIIETNTGTKTLDVTEDSIPNKTLVSIESLVIIITLGYIAYMIYSSINTSVSKKSYYAKAIYKILKNYGDVVAEIVKPIDLKYLNVIDVKNFDQMLDIEEELRIPIMFYETIKNEEGWFILVHNDIAYRYILRDKLK